MVTLVNFRYNLFGNFDSIKDITSINRGKRGIQFEIKIS